MGLLREIWKNKDLIIDGIKNKYLTTGDIKEEINKIADSRKVICSVCPFMSENAKKVFNYKTQRFDKHCTKCGCNIDLKTHSLASSCPDNPPRWDAIVSEDEFSNIEQIVKDYEESTSQEHQNKSASGDIKEL